MDELKYMNPKACLSVHYNTSRARRTPPAGRGRAVHAPSRKGGIRMAIPSTWSFWQRPAAVPLAEPVWRQLVADRGLTAQAAAALRMLTRRGSYAGRPVTDVRVVDPTAVARAGVALRRFGDLDEHEPLLLHEGHIERNGQVVLNRRRVGAGGDSPMTERGRSSRADVHIESHEGGWSVREDERPGEVRHFASQGAAVERAVSAAGRIHGQVVIHGRDGGVLGCIDADLAAAALMVTAASGAPGPAADRGRGTASRRPRGH
jgi:hypothetical protein